MKLIKQNSHHLIILLVCLITFSSYYLAVNGPFLYDDTANLSPLSYNTTNSPNSDALAFIFGNSAGPLGRPVAMATFFLNSTTWPAEPYWFKLTNLMIHLICGLLIYLLIPKVICSIEPKLKTSDLKFITLMISAFWLLHPLHISTTLYTIQRMTQLSLLFSLTSLLMFYYYRPLIVQSENYQKYILPSSLLFISISLAVFSKENAILIFPILILANYFYSDSSQSLRYKIWFYSLTILPSLIAIMLLIYNSSLHVQGLEYRGVSFGDKLLTEFRILSHYLKQILIPDINFMTLFHDDIVISDSLFKPTTTFLSLLFITGLLGTLFLKIKAIYKFSIAWFFIWHILESTILPLDLYFEHRNYAASIGPLLALSYGIYDFSQNVSIKRKIVVLLPIVCCIFLVFQMTTLTKKWADEETLLLHWLTHHEKSKATLLTLTQYYEKNQQLEIAHSITSTAVKYDHLKDDLATHLSLYTQECILNKNTSNTLQKIHALSKDKQSYSFYVLQFYVKIVLNILQGYCKPQNFYKIHEILSSIEQNAPQSIHGKWLSDVQSKHAFLYLYENNLTKALEFFIKAYRIQKPDIAVAIVDINIKLGKIKEARYWANKLLNNDRVKKYLTADIISQINQLNKRLIDIDK